MTDEKNLKQEESKPGENSGTQSEESSAILPLQKDGHSAEEESDLEQQRKEALTERD